MVIILMKRKGQYSGGNKGGRKKKVGYDFYRDEKMGPVISPPIQKKKIDLKCPSCGASSPMHDKFCTICGKSLLEKSAKIRGPKGRVIWAKSNEKQPLQSDRGRSAPPAVGRKKGRGAEEVERGIKCRVCGAALSENEKFCTACGSSRKISIQKKSCLVCGAALSENEKFCTACGSSRKISAQIKSCLVCGAILPENERFCTLCGTQTGPRHSENNVETKKDTQTNTRYYEILEIEPGASRTEIKKAFKKKIIEYHPDKVHSLGKKLREIAEEETKKITEAYRALMKE